MTSRTLPMMFLVMYVSGAYVVWSSPYRWFRLGGMLLFTCATLGTVVMGMKSEESGGYPDKSDEKKDWILERAGMIEIIREESWIRDKVEFLFENPDIYEEGDAFEEDPPDDVDREDWILFQYAFNFGVEYERLYPSTSENEQED